MAEKQKAFVPPPGLRFRAEARPDSHDGRVDEHLSLAASNEIIHELRVHQIELEMQNEELRETMVALETSRERYFELYDLAPIGYLTLSEKGLITESNLTAAGLLGEPRSMLVRQPLSRFFLPEDMGRYFQFRQRLLETGRPQRCDLQLLTKDGAVSWVRLEATVVHGPDGARNIRTALSDVSQHKAIERLLHDQTDNLEAALRKMSLIAKLLPVCRDCKRIRGEKKEWQDLDELLSQVAADRIPQVICEECLLKLGPNDLEGRGSGMDEP
jgi:PAS domain S-box-containing protein